MDVHVFRVSKYINIARIARPEGGAGVSEAKAGSLDFDMTIKFPPH